MLHWLVALVDSEIIIARATQPVWVNLAAGSISRSALEHRVTSSRAKRAAPMISTDPMGIINAAVVEKQMGPHNIEYKCEV